jgi:hypothetical protein
MHQFRDYALAGGPMSYGISIADGYGQAGICFPASVAAIMLETGFDSQAGCSKCCGRIAIVVHRSGQKGLLS